MSRIFWGFCINWILIDLLHYIVRILKRKLPSSVSWRVVDSPESRYGESGSRHSKFFKFISARLNQPFKGPI
jgi:hypothetical protein